MASNNTPREQWTLIGGTNANAVQMIEAGWKHLNTVVVGEKDQRFLPSSINNSTYGQVQRPTFLLKIFVRTTDRMKHTNTIDLHHYTLWN